MMPERQTDADKDRRPAMGSGKTTFASNSSVAHAVDAAHFNGLWVDSAEGAGGVEIDRKEHTEGDQKQLCGLSDPETKG